MYSQFTVPFFTKRLKTLHAMLKKAQAEAIEKKISDEVVLALRLAPDMLPFVKQVQVCSDNAKGAISKLSGIENVKMEDNETTFDQLITRIEKTLEYIQSNANADFSKGAEKIIEFPWAPGKYLEGEEYLVHHVVPNYMFHESMVYAILRSNGFNFGKGDFLSQVDMKNK